jgi:hypothetical protein
MLRAVLDALIFACAVAFLAFAFGWTFYSIVRSPAADVTEIKAAYEGLQGLAGPNLTVVSVKRDGFVLGRPPQRIYEVQLRRVNGTSLVRTALVTARLVGSGPIYDQGGLYS